MTAEYIKRLKSEDHCSETFINIFVFFTLHLRQRISVFAHFCVTLAKFFVEQFPEKYYQ